MVMVVGGDDGGGGSGGVVFVVAEERMKIAAVARLSATKKKGRVKGQAVRLGGRRALRSVLLGKCIVG